MNSTKLPSPYPVSVPAARVQPPVPSSALPTGADTALPVYIREPAAGSPALRETEWLLTNGIGGFAMGTALGIPTRRYHGLLIASMAPPVQRALMLHSLVETVVIEPGTPRERSFDLASFRFRGGVEHPQGHTHCIRFEKGPGAACRWIYRAESVEIVKTLRLYRDHNAAAIEYTIRPGPHIAQLRIRPLVAMRDSHSLLHKEWSAHEFRTEPGARGVRVLRGQRAFDLSADAGSFDADAQWWYSFQYEIEADRGYDDSEDLFSPGVFTLQTRARAEQSLTLQAFIRGDPGGGCAAEDDRTNRKRLSGLVEATLAGVPASEQDRAALVRLVTASDDFVVRRGRGPDAGVSVIAGYPWFSDWGRDTMISLPGLLLAAGRFDEAHRVLETFARHRRNGLIPNLFNDQTGEAEYNTVDAALWFLHAACEYLRLTGDRKGFSGQIRAACLEVIDWYRRGTDYAIRMDPADGLIAAGDESSQLTWMDARRDGIVFTPRHGKAVEINALWHHGLLSVVGAIEGDDSNLATEFEALAARAAASFRRLFWNPVLSCCHDVMLPGPKGTWVPDVRVRPNQIFAASLERSPLTAEQRAGVVRCVKDRLLTPAGLRTLDPADPGFKPRYAGPMRERDAAYHNGTAWPWLLGPYAEAVMRVGGFSEGSRAEARAALRPLIDLLDGPAMGQLAEVFDGAGSPKLPQKPGGCMAQAWSIAEPLRVWLMSLSSARGAPRR